MLGLIKETLYKIMFGLIEKMFIGLLTGLVNGIYSYKMGIVKQSEMHDSTYSY